MLIGEYDYDTDIEVRCEEAHEAGYNQGFEAGEDKGITKGAHQQAIETAKEMKHSGYDLAEISRLTKLSASEIKSL